MTTYSKHTLRVLTVPAFNDNYLWLIHDGVHAAVVDPGDGHAILAALEAHHLTLCAILLTHHHPDHVGGVPELLQHFAVPVFGPAKEVIASVTHTLAEGDVVDVPDLALRLSVLDVPGHTSGHIAYLLPEDATTNEPAKLFCGDTLFAGGCGRLFEGTPEQMFSSLGKLSALPDDTQVFCAHEYTLANLRFASAVEPDNAELIIRVERETGKRALGQPTVPSTIALEKASNPFLRCAEPAIVAGLIAAEKIAPNASPVAVFAALRRWKDNF
ncbi:MAG: hydroxyacylglutathione hydrolase [Janthinobacterium sp.]|jgi:hydroxyacylglutathione hydrolase